MELLSGKNKLIIDDNSGTLVSLQNDNRECIKKHDKKSPFQFHFPFKDFESHIITASSSVPALTNQGNTLKYRYDNLLGSRGPSAVDAVYSVVSKQDGSFALSLTITNRSSTAIPQLFFPWIGGLAAVDGNNDQVSFGKSVFFPHRSWKPLQDYEKAGFMRYSGSPHYIVFYADTYRSGMKWMDYGSARAGCSLFSTQTDAEDLFLLVHRNSWFKAGPIHTAMMSYPYIMPGETFFSPEYILYPHEGGWPKGVTKFRIFTRDNFTPLPRNVDEQTSLGLQTLWISRHYQDWRKVRLRFSDIPDIAAEARAAGIRHLTIARATALDFCLPHQVRKELGGLSELRLAFQRCRDEGSRCTLFISCRLIRETTINASSQSDEWYVENVAGQRHGDNWTYHPRMLPAFPIQQIGSRAAYYICPASQNWRKSLFAFVDKLVRDWDADGLMFDQSFSTGELCFNPLHDHKPSDYLKNLELVLREIKFLITRSKKDGLLGGEGHWDKSTEWMNFTWDWYEMTPEEPAAPFHMAFPQARTMIKCSTDISHINRLFTAGYQLDLYLEEGSGRLSSYPELSEYLQSLFRFKSRFRRFFDSREEYLYTEHIHCSRTSAWYRSHKHGDEFLVLITARDGSADRFNLEIDVEAMTGKRHVRIEEWSRELRLLHTASYSAHAELTVEVGHNDFTALLCSPAAGREAFSHP